MPETGLEMTQDNKMLQDNFEFFNNTVDNEADEDDGSWKTGPGKTNDTIVGVGTCVSISYDPGTEIKTLHFGLDSLTGEYVDCECSDGRMRRGKINLTFNGNYFLEGVTTTSGGGGFFPGCTCAGRFHDHRQPTLKCCRESAKISKCGRWHVNRTGWKLEPNLVERTNVGDDWRDNHHF